MPEPRRGAVATPALLGVLAVLALGLFVSRVAGCTGSGSDLPVITLDVGGHRVKAEVASTSAARSRGLMYRRSMAKNAGMLFVYPETRVLSFWMKNTYLPLDIAFIDADGTIRDLTQMRPLTTTSHASAVPVRYALEMNAGWFEGAGVGVGGKVSFALPAGLTPEGD